MKNTIILDQNYSLEIAGDCVTLFFEEFGDINKRTGKATKRTSSWHCTSLKNALKRYVDTSLQKCATIDLVLQRLSELNEKIDNLDL